MANAQIADNKDYMRRQEFKKWHETMLKYGADYRVDAYDRACKLEKAQCTNEEKDDENNNKKLLKEIKSDLVSINLIEGVYEYEVDIDSDILELDLEPIAIDNTYKIDISSQKLSEIEDNKIIIKVSDNKDKTEEYVIKLNIKEKVVNEDISIENNNYNSKWITVVVISAVILVLGLILLKKNS